MTDELIVDGYALDLSEGLPVPISFAIADIKDPSKRKQSFSKETTIPGTMNNLAFFTGAFSFTTTDNGVSFDATAKAPVILKKRGVQVLSGVLKLDEVKIDNRVVSFVCTVLSDSVDLFQLLATIGINELDWSSYDHALNRTNIKASWTTGAGTGYRYPLIERGNGRLGNTIWRTTDVMPYVHLREVLFKSLEWAGIEWDSDFLDTTQFKNILFGYGGGEIRTLSTADQSARRVFIDTGDFATDYTSLGSSSDFVNNTAIQRTLQYSLNPPSINPFSDAYFTGVEVSDTLNQFDDGEIAVQKTGNYSLRVTCALDYVIDDGTMSFDFLQQPFIRVMRNGLILYVILDSQNTFNTATGTITFDTNTTFNIFAESGDVISFKIGFGLAYATAGVGIEAQPLSIDVTTNGTIEVDFSSTDTVITDGATVRLGNYLPNMKCSDFLLGVIRQFALYISDPDLNGVVKIEPITDFYSDTNDFLDITQDIDHSKQITMRPAANEYAKYINFTFKESSDFDATKYFDKWEEQYGDYNYTQSSYYAKGENKTQLPWGTIIPFEVAPSILVPRFVKIENNVMKQNTGAPRIMFWNGTKTGSFTLRDTVGTGSEVLTAYPCVHHFDNWTNPTMDLNFKLVNEVYYTATVVTTVNCYSEYYSTSINEMTSPAGQFVNVSVVWDEQVIKARDFGKLLMINGGLFRLNEIKEFSADVQTSTEIELVKVLKAKKSRRVQISLPALASTGGQVISAPGGNGQGTGVISGGLGTSLVNNHQIRG